MAVDRVIEIEGLTKSFGRFPRPQRPRPAGRARRGARLPRPERCRQVDDDPGAARPAEGRRRNRATARRGSLARRGAAAPATGLRAGRRVAVAGHDRRRGHRPARHAARRSRRGPASGPRRALRARPDQARPPVLQGQQAEGRDRRGAGVGRGAARPRRADERPGPVDGERLPGGHQGGEAARHDGAAVEPHPRRGRVPRRPGEHHPRRRRRLVRDDRATCAARPAPRSTRRWRRIPGPGRASPPWATCASTATG